MPDAEIPKAKMHSPDLTQDNIAKLRDIFPGCVTEAADDKGAIRLAVDFDQLRQELSDKIVEGPQERYRLDWPGKREALLTANAPIAKTLRPARDESVNFDTTQNLFIEGDNLDALKLLQESYLGKVKMIYIDPPYNTGNDFIYEDDFAEDTAEFLARSNQKDEEGNRLVANTESNGRFHSDWLSMMYARLKLARNLLADDGLAFISIDEKEASYLKIVCDSVFGPANFVEQIAWKNKYGSGALTKGFANVHEYVFVYSKGNAFGISAPLDESQRLQYKNRDAKFEKRGGFITQPLATNSKDDRKNLVYPLIHNGIDIWPEKQWIWAKERLQSAYENDEVVVNEKNGKFSVRSKQYLRDEHGRERLGKPISLLNGPFNQDGTKEVVSLFGSKVFDFPKPSKLIQYFSSFQWNGDESKNWIFLDFFAGSAASAQAIMAQNAEDGGKRKFIMVQFPEVTDEKSPAFKAGYKNIAEISKERIRRAGSKILEGETHKDWNKDVGFRVLKVDTSNMADIWYTPEDTKQADMVDAIQNIKPDRSREDLLFQLLIDWGVDLSLPIARETMDGKTIYRVDDNALIACFDNGVNEALVKQLAALKPLRAVFKDNGFADNATKINVTQIFKQLSPDTDVKSI